ncbi:hypothetical protein H8D30_04950 [bacterium]|nr:hypothetical protein [bacterium]
MNRLRLGTIWILPFLLTVALGAGPGDETKNKGNRGGGLPWEALEGLSQDEIAELRAWLAKAPAFVKERIRGRRDNQNRGIVRAQGDRDDSASTEDRMRQAMDKIHAAVEAGDITPEEAREKIAGLRRRIGDQGGGDHQGMGGQDMMGMGNHRQGGGNHDQMGQGRRGRGQGRNNHQGMRQGHQGGRGQGQMGQGHQRGGQGWSQGMGQGHRGGRGEGRNNHQGMRQGHQGGRGQGQMGQGHQRGGQGWSQGMGQGRRGRGQGRNNHQGMRQGHQRMGSNEGGPRSIEREFSFPGGEGRLRMEIHSMDGMPMMGGEMPWGDGPPPWMNPEMMGGMGMMGVEMHIMMERHHGGASECVYSGTSGAKWDASKGCWAKDMEHAMVHHVQGEHDGEHQGGRHNRRNGGRQHRQNH